MIKNGYGFGGSLLRVSYKNGDPPQTNPFSKFWTPCQNLLILGWPQLGQEPKFGPKLTLKHILFRVKNLWGESGG